MFKKMCVWNKVLIFFLLLILADLGMVFFLEGRVEKELVRIPNNILRENTLMSLVFGNDYDSNYLIKQTIPVLEGSGDDRSAYAVIRRYRNQVVAIFGISLLAGIVLIIVTSRNLMRPILQIVSGGNPVQKDSIMNSSLVARCSKLQALTDSMKKVENRIMEDSEENKRVAHVEITKNLAAGIAHEIKNPINSVGLIVDYLQSNLSPDDAEKRYEFYKLSENMKSELKRINRIVEGFLRLTKPNAYRFENLNVNDVIETTAALFETESLKQDVSVTLNLDPDIPLIKADKDRLRQVFSNLIINAVEAMPRGGDVKISSEMNKDGQVRIAFADSGIGIPEEDMKRVFDPHYSTKKQGFGLGLPLIQDIIHRHHGRIGIKSEKGMGTTFSIVLPVDFSDE